MSQSFQIINQNKKQYLNPLVIPCSEKFPSIIRNHLMPKLITWLICNSANILYKKTKNSSYYCQKHMGAWYGDAIVIIGNYDEEELYREVIQDFSDVTIEAMAMLIEKDDDLAKTLVIDAKEGLHHFEYVAKIASLEYCPKNFKFELVKEFGEHWKERIYKNR